MKKKKIKPEGRFVGYELRYLTIKKKKKKGNK